MSKLSIIKGILPKKLELINWSQEKLLSFIKFCRLCIKDDIFKYDAEFEQKVKESDDKFFKEFLLRCTKKGGSYVSKRTSLVNMYRTVGGYLKSNPFIITEEMESICKTTPRLSWMLEAFAEKDSAMGAKIVVVNNTETTDVNRTNAAPSTTNVSLPEVQFNQSMLKMSSLLNTMLKGITNKDLKDMDVKDKMKLAIPMLATLQKSLNSKRPNSLVFKKLVVNSAGKDDLERAILEYSQDQE